MKPEIKKIWIKALTSGKYKQGKHNLKKGNKYCCLGVLCDLYIKKNPKTTFSWDKIEPNSEKNAFLPPAIMKWSGIKTNEADFGYDKGDDLIHLNDEGKSFKKIAKVIEKEF